MSRANYNFMPVSWRTLVKAAGVIVLALPAILRAQDGVAEKQESRIEIKRRGSQPPTEAPAEHFTGRVRIEPLFQENDPSHTSAAYVTFERLRRPSQGTQKKLWPISGNDPAYQRGIVVSLLSPP